MRIQKPADLARVVKTRRQAQDLTQQDIANAAGITRQSLARIERGHGGASFDTILRIFEALGVELETTSTETSHTPASTTATNRDELESALVSTSTAAHRIDSSTLHSARRTTLSNVTVGVQETAVGVGSTPSIRAARLAFLNAAIEAGDPDRPDAETDGEAEVKNLPGGASNG